MLVKWLIIFIPFFQMENSDSTSTSSESDVELDEGVNESYRCLLCDTETTTVFDFFDHLDNVHQWKLQEETRLFSDQYTWICFVNWSRKTKPSQWNDFFSLTESHRQSYLQPTIQDDEVLMIGMPHFLYNESFFQFQI